MTYSNNNGFSLIEVALVLALLAIVVMLVGANCTFINRLLVRSEVDTLYTTCRYAQHCALASNTPQEITFDVVRKIYKYRGVEHKLPAQVDFGFIPGAKGPPSAPTNTIHKPVTFVHDRITFYPDGIIKSGTVYLTDTARQYMYALSSPIAQVSYLRKYQYNGQWQLIS